MSILYNNIGSAHAQLGNYQKSEDAFKKSIAYAEKVGAQQVILQDYKDLADLYAKAENYKSQSEYLNNYYTLKDSLFTIEKDNQLAQLESEYVIEKKDLELEASRLKIEKEEKENTIYTIVICSGFLLMILLIYFFSRTRKKNKLLQEQNILISDQKQEIEKALNNLKSTQAQLIQSEKIQNPLNFVNNFSEVSNELVDEMNEELEKGDIDEAKAISEDVKQNLEKITYHGKRADSIVKGMLQHSRNSAGEKEPTDLNKLTDEYMRLAYHGLRAKNKSFNATLNTEFDDALRPQTVVPQDIGRVLLNLFTNAYYAVNEKDQLLKAKGQTDYQPTITASTSETASDIIITVKDNGNGIPKESIKRIFEPFYTTKPTGQGTGLGLSMSYDIIKNHEGELSVNAKTGEFTEFTIRLPKTDT